jgi:thiol-disulfide isomerase/thioredoxin
MVKKVYKMSAIWCAPCRVYAQTFGNVSKMDAYKDIEFKEFDADENEELFIKYAIRGVPTTLFLDENDKELIRISGNVPQKTLTDTIDFYK